MSASKGTPQTISGELLAAASRAFQEVKKEEQKPATDMPPGEDTAHRDQLLAAEVQTYEELKKEEEEEEKAATHAKTKTKTTPPHAHDHTYATAPGGKRMKTEPASPTTTTIVTRKRAVVPKSPEEKERAEQLLKDLRAKKGGRPKLECEICPPGRTFTVKASLANHLLSQHTGRKQHFCPYPGCASEGFTRQSSLNYHLDLHKGIYPHTCQYCGKKFRHRSHFKEHEHKHTGAKPWECQFCENKYRLRNTYKRHLRTAHGWILTQDGLYPTTEEEMEKVRTKTNKKTANIKVNSSSSTSGESSPSPKRERASSSTAMRVPGLNMMTPTPQPSSEATPLVFPGHVAQGNFVHYPSIVYPIVPMALVQTATMPPVTHGVDHSGTTAQVVFNNDISTLVNVGAMASSQDRAGQSLSSQPMIRSQLPMVPSLHMLVPASQLSVGSTHAPGHNHQPMVADMQLALPTSQPVAPGPQFPVASSVSASPNPNFQPPLPRP